MVSIEKSAGGEASKISPVTLAYLEQFPYVPAPQFFRLDKYPKPDLENPKHPYAARMMHQNDILLNNFLAETPISHSFGHFTKMLRMFKPIRTSSIEFDTRMFESEETWMPLLTSTIYRPKSSAFEWTIFIHGRPRPWEKGEENLTYDIALPVHIDYSHDPSRPAQATIVHKEAGEWNYNQAAYPEYGESNPDVMIQALRYASTDFADLVRYTFAFELVPSYIENAAPLAQCLPTSRERVAKVIADLLK